MAKSYSEITKLSKKLTSSRKKVTDGPKSYKDIKVSDYSFNGVREQLENTIRFDTLQSDLSSMGKTIEDSYNNWQTQETLNNTRSSIESMQSRLGAYNEYQRLFGGKDNTNSIKEIDTLRDEVMKTLDGWDNLSKEYGKYKNADAYTSEKNKLTELYSMDSKQLKGKKGVAYTTSDGYNIKWEDLYNDAYSREYEADVDKTIDFSKSGNYKKKDAKLSKTWNGYVVVGDEDAYLYNYVNDDKEARDSGTLTNVYMSGTYDFLKNKYLTEDEKARFNALWETQGPEKAKEYLGLLDSDLRQRRVEHEKTLYAKDATENPFATSVASVIQNLGNNAMALPFLAMDYAEDGNIDPNSSLYTGRRQVQTTRSTVEENIESDVGQFFYRHGMNIADNLATRAVSLGVGSGAASRFLMSSGAVVDTVLDAKERGLSDAQAIGLGAISGAAEWYFESKGFESWVDTKTLSRSAWTYFANNLKTELVGEIFTEGTNDIADFFIAQDVNKLNTEYKSLLASGMSDKDAFLKVVGGVAERYVDVAAGTILSTGVMSGPGATIGGIQQHSFNKNIGKTIKANERVTDVFDIANNPDIASAYDTYTRYANKGINADNISDTKLGRLYTNAKMDAMEVLDSKSSTDEQKSGALKTLAKLSTVKTENTVAKEKKKLNVGEETKVTESGETVDIKDLKVSGEDVLLATENGEISVDEVTFSDKDADLVSFAKQISKTDGEDVANLFISQYDGKTDIDEYANSFNLTMAYAKNNFTYDTILNKKGALSTDQVNAIYQETRIKADKAKADAIKKLNKKMADKNFYKGIIDESVIDYENTSAEGKINWKDLDVRQQQAITFVKGFAQATGMNLKLISNGLELGINGAYSVKDNTITLDIYAGIDHVDNLRDTIIPTMSHETTHWMKEKSPELWRNLNEIVFSTLTEHYNLNTEQSIKDKIELLDRLEPRVKHTEEDVRDRTITEEDLIRAEMNRKGKSADVSREEIIARACEDMLKMSEQGKKMFNSLSEVEQKTFVEKIKGIINDLLNWVNDLLNSYEASSTEARIMREYKEQLQKASKVWDEMLKKSVETNQALEKSNAYGHITSIGSHDLSDLSEVVNTDGEQLFQYRAMVEDEEIYRKMLLKHKDTIGISNKEINGLFNLIDNAVDIISNNLEALDYAWDADINERAYSPIKPNSDSLYQVSLDFSTLCRKRLLQQTIQNTLQEALNKNLSKEESIAIRDELIKVQEEGRKIEVACALCYVESVRMKSPVQINKFLNNREDVIKEFFANRSGGSIKEKIQSAEMKARETLKKNNPDGYIGKNGVSLDVLTAPKSKMRKADADFVRAEGKKAKASYQLTEHEQVELDAALKMSISDFTSAKGLENLAKHHKDLFDAYTSFVRNATHSKGIENDTWWRAGDSESIGDGLIAQMNKENGLRSQSWSDFQVIHLLDYIAATIELSTKGAKRQSYTKVPDYVKLLGNTGDMINMSLIPERVFNGKLAYDSVEGMAYEIAKQLRDEYHSTVGTICIGISNEQIRMLLEDGTIDMVIPYHHSAMSAATRRLMHIPTWESYQNYQSEKNLSDAEAMARAKEYGVELKKDDNYQKAPKFSEWFNLDEARQIAKLENANPSDAKAYKKYGKMYGGYMAMQNAANNYLKLCAERGIAPKFSNEKADFTHDANYWKLLIDRKMVDNVTGEIIEQKPIKPIFNEKSVLEILNDELARYPQVKADQEYALRKVAEKFLSGEMRVDKSTLDAIKKPVDNISNVNILESSRDNETLYSERVSNEELASADDTALYIKNTKNANYIKMIFNGAKTEETRSRRTLDAFIGKEFYVTDGEYVYGSVVFGEPHKYTEADFHKRENQLKHRVPKGDEYDIKKGGIKWAYPIESYKKFDKPKKLSESKEYKNSFQARQILYNESDSITTNNLRGYSQHQIDNWKNSKSIVIYEGESQFRGFVEGAISNGQFNKKIYLGAITKEFASIIKEKTGIDVENFNCSISASEIRKIFKDHGNEEKEALRGQRAVTVDDILNVREVLQNPEEISLSPRKYNGKPVIHFVKNIDGKYTVPAVVSDKHLDLFVQTLYIGIKKRNLSTPIAEQAAINTPKASGGTVSDNSISNQDKNVNTFFSDRDNTSIYDLMSETERIKKENEKFKAEVERLKERLKIERQVTKGNYFNENQLGTVAGHLRNISKSNIDKVELVNSLKDVYSFIAHSPVLTWEDVFERCYRVAEDMIAESKPDKMVNDYYKQILWDVRNSKISFSEMQKQEASHIFGKNWNRNFFGRVNITDSGIPVDSQWGEWASMYPDIFDADITDTDMPGELYDIINSLQDASETIVKYDVEEQTRWLAREIYNQYWNVSPIRTTADKYDKKIKLLNFEHRRAMAEFRQEYDTRLKEQHKADKERYKKLVADIRERKDKQIALAKQHGREMLTSYKENAERKTHIQRITADALSLNELLVKNSKEKHVPEIMKGPVTTLLKAIDFSSKRMLDKGLPTQNDISLSKALSKVKDMMVKATNAHDELVELYGHGLDDDIEKMVDSVDTIMRTVGDNEFILNKMTLADLQTLDKVVKTIRHAVNKLNKFHTVNHARGIANLSRESVSYLDSLGKGKIYDGKRGAIKKLLDWGNALPYYVFKRFGNGGMKVYEALQDGWDKFAFNIKEVIDYANETYTSEEVKEWSKDVKTFKILVPATDVELADENYKPKYQEVQLTISQIMSLHCLNKREQARGHLFQGGIRVADIKTKKGEIISQSEGIIFTEKDISTILNSLTGRQKEVANKLQRFMNTVTTDWGNEVSMARFGYKAFGEENYFPIQSDKNNLAVNDETEQQNSLFKLLNMSFTKSTIEKANNRIVISDIFDVFAQHTSDMAKYNALALPVLDSFKWYNYTEKEPIAEGTFKTSGVKQSIESAFGKDGQNYFTTFLKDINGQQEVSRDTLGKGFFSNAKIAAVGANLRVVFLQPTSYARASAVIDNKYLTKALMHKPKTKRAETHCGIALWKSMGYYDTNIQRGVEAQIKHADTWKDKATDWSMKGAEIADKVTWGYLWNACELEIRDTRKDLKVGSKEFYEAIGKRLREVIYATQVVDSTMTRSQMMRSTDGRDKFLTAFASEPTLSYNMLQDAYMEYSLDARQIGKKEAIKKNGKRIGRILFAYTMTNALAALVESGFDAFRDDDDEEMDYAKFMQYYLSNFANDMSITAKIPVIKEFHSAIQGFGSSRTDTQWMEEITKAMKTWYKIFNGKGNASTAIKYSIKGISDLSGLPFYSVYRDAMAALNKLDLFTAEDLNEMFEDFFD